MNFCETTSVFTYSVSRRLYSGAGVLDANECIFHPNIARLATARSDIDVDDHSVNNCLSANLYAGVFDVVTNSDRNHLCSISNDTDAISCAARISRACRTHKLLDPAGLFPSGHFASPDPRGTHMG